MTRFACGYGGCPLDGPHLHEHKPAVPATPTCACGKPGSYRGDPDKGYQTMKCPDCCAGDAVMLALVRDRPPAFITKIELDIIHAMQAVSEARVSAGPLGIQLRMDLRSHLDLARSQLVLAAGLIEGAK